MRRVDFIKCVRTAWLPIEVLIEYFGLVRQRDETIQARREILQEQRAHLVARMAEMQETLNLSNYKMQVYENAVLKTEQELID